MANTPDMLLTMHGISKSFGAVPVLTDVQFDLRAGEVHVLAGENGAGKSTLIKILSGAHTDYLGEIRLAGRAVQFKSPHDAARHGISVIHQEMSLIPAMTVLDNICLGREATRPGGWLNRSAQRHHAERVLTRLGLDVDLDAPVEDHPLSVQQMIEIAKAQINEARIMIMDEPTSALTEVEVDRLFELIADLKVRGCGIIYISHRMDEFYRVGDRVTVLRDGRRVGTDNLRDLKPDQLIRGMVGREIRQQFPDRDPQWGDERLSLQHFSVPHPSARGRWAVQDVTLQVRAGEILGLAGLQGSGNTELLHGLFGAYGHSTRGEVNLDRRRYRISSPGRSIAKGLALLTNDRQKTGLVHSMNLTRNITMASAPKFSPCGWMRPRRETATARNHVQSLGVRAAAFDEEVWTLSGGNQQKVAVAKWLETGANVLLLDEPTRGVDVAAKHDIYTLMNQWTDAGAAILLITSELPELLAMSDRIMVMHRGRVSAEFSRADATQENILHAAMGGMGTS